MHIYAYISLFVCACVHTHMHVCVCVCVCVCVQVMTCVPGIYARLAVAHAALGHEEVALRMRERAEEAGQQAQILKRTLWRALPRGNALGADFREFLAAGLAAAAAACAL